MKTTNNALNYEARVLANNGALAEFDFHADSPDLAEDHINHLVNVRDGTLIFNWKDILPDAIHHISYKKKNNIKWRCILKKSE